MNVLNDLRESMWHLGNKAQLCGVTWQYVIGVKYSDLAAALKI